MTKIFVVNTIKLCITAMINHVFTMNLLIFTLHCGEILEIMALKC